MYAVINIPGSSHFHSYGPETKKNCEAWLERTMERLLKTEPFASIWPRQIISNKRAESWRWRDGTQVFPRRRGN